MVQTRRLQIVHRECFKWGDCKWRDWRLFAEKWRDCEEITDCLHVMIQVMRIQILKRECFKLGVYRLFKTKSVSRSSLQTVFDYSMWRQSGLETFKRLSEVINEATTGASLILDYPVYFWWKLNKITETISNIVSAKAKEKEGEGASSVFCSSFIRGEGDGVSIHVNVVQIFKK